MPNNNQYPSGFFSCFLAEMWERYGYYTIQALLMLHMLMNFHVSTSDIYAIMGSFTGLAFLNSVIGGFIADFYLGKTFVLLIGNLLLIIGYTMLGVVTDINWLYEALAMITMGTGLLKPNISSIVGLLYDNHHDLSSKDRGYTVYYVGIYFGAVGGSFIGGYLNKWFGINVAFFVASAGTFVGMLTFLYGNYKYKFYRFDNIKYTWQNACKATLLFIVSLAISCFVMRSELMAIICVSAMAFICAGFLLFYIIYYTGQQRFNLIIFSILVLSLVIYWAINLQQFFSLNVFMLSGQLPIPASTVPSIEAVGVIIFGIIINRLWDYFKRVRYHVSMFSKFVLGFLFSGMCFAVLTMMVYMGSMLNMWMIVVAYLMLSIGEVFISPTSLSMVTTLVPHKIVSFMMGVSLLSIGLGAKFAGVLAAVLSDYSATVIPGNKFLPIFTIYSAISIIICIILYVLNKYIRIADDESRQ